MGPERPGWQREAEHAASTGFGGGRCLLGGLENSVMHRGGPVDGYRKEMRFDEPIWGKTLS